MPDENKFKCLREIGYTIFGTCQLCLHGLFHTMLARQGLPVPSVWGTCAINKYDHKKHTEGGRGVSIHPSGTCSMFQADPARTGLLGAHLEFFNGKTNCP